MERGTTQETWYSRFRHWSRFLLETASRKPIRTLRNGDWIDHADLYRLIQICNFLGYGDECIQHTSKAYKSYTDVREQRIDPFERKRKRSSQIGSSSSCYASKIPRLRSAGSGSEFDDGSHGSISTNTDERDEADGGTGYADHVEDLRPGVSLIFNSLSGDTSSHISAPREMTRSDTDQREFLKSARMNIYEAKLMPKSATAQPSNDQLSHGSAKWARRSTDGMFHNTTKTTTTYQTSWYREIQFSTGYVNGRCKWVLHTRSVNKAD